MCTKKNLLIVIIFIAAVASMLNAEAGYLTLKDENDIERVSNNVIHFYVSHYDDLISMEKKGFNKEECLKDLDNIINAKAELYLDFIHNKKQFRIDFTCLKSYVKTNEELIQRIIGQEKYQSFINGLFYIHYILKML
jgi:hypothetical protein